MKEFLTEWLIRYGTNDVRISEKHEPYWFRAVCKDYLGGSDTTEHPDYHITPKGLEYLKDERISD